MCRHIEQSARGRRDQDESIESNIFAYSVIEDARPVAITTEKISLESSKDKAVTMLNQAIESGEWQKFQGSIYKAVKDELWRCGNIVIRGDRIVMPVSQWKQTLRLAQEEH